MVPHWSKEIKLHPSLCTYRNSCWAL